MQTDRCCWGWWRIHCQQHYSVFPLLYPSYSWQMQRHQFSTNFPISPPSSFPFRCQKLLNLSSSLPYSHPFPQCTVQVCLYCKKSWMGSVVNSTNNVAGRGHIQHSADTVWQPPSLSVWWPSPARKNSQTEEVGSEAVIPLLALAKFSFTVLSESVSSSAL